MRAPGCRDGGAFLEWYRKDEARAANPAICALVLRVDFTWKKLYRGASGPERFANVDRDCPKNPRNLCLDIP